MSRSTTIHFPPADNIALIAESSLTFGDVRRWAAAIADDLHRSGLRTGDRVAIATTHRTSFYCGFASCFASGFPVVVIDPLAATQEIALMLDEATPSAIIADDAVLRRVSEFDRRALPRIARSIGLRESQSDMRGRLSSLLARLSLSTRFKPLEDLANATAEIEPVLTNETLPAYVMFTSGTTSKPKAAVVSRAALHHHVGTLSKVFGYNGNVRLLCYLPTHHTDGLVHGVAASLMTGMTVVQPGTFDSTVDLKLALRKNNVTHFLVVPTILALIHRMYVDDPELFQYDDFDSLISTAGHLDKAFWKKVQQFFGIRVSNFYGMTETVSGSLYCGPNDDSFRIGTLGKPVDAEVRIVDENGNPVPSDTIGELQISGEHLMTGYLNDRAATDAVLTDNWLSTGDLFTRDEDGFFRIVGRKKNVIKRGGITVYPEDIQKIVNEMPGVLEVEVIGLPNEMFEEIIVVCAVVEPGVSRDDIRKTCRNSLSPERRPDRVVLMVSLPRGPSGKVRRNVLLSMLGEDDVGSQGASNSVRDRVISIAANTFVVEPSVLNENSSPDTLDNWDSYAGMEFVFALEKEFALRLPPRAIMQLRNIGAAIEIVAARVNVDDTDK